MLSFRHGSHGSNKEKTAGAAPKTITACKQPQRFQATFPINVGKNQRFFYERHISSGKSRLSLFPPFHPTFYLPGPCQDRSFFVCSSYKLPIYRYGEYSKNIRRNHDPGKTRTGGEFGSRMGRREKSRERKRESARKYFGLAFGFGHRPILLEADISSGTEGDAVPAQRTAPSNIASTSNFRRSDTRLYRIRRLKSPYRYIMAPFRHSIHQQRSITRHKEKIQKNLINVLVVQIKAISLHPQTRNDGGIAQLVRAHDS